LIIFLYQNNYLKFKYQQLPRHPKVRHGLEKA